ncbi:MAG: restriction endonuclease subunit S [Clostridia bacterium]|nr:restriction endonuclease subunit S [Clostridia bacterium]
MKMIRLGDIATIYNGNSINATVKKEKYMKNVPGWNYIGTKDVGFDGTISYNTGVIIPYFETGFRIAPAGSIFVCSEGGSAGKKTAIVNEDVCFGNKLFAIVNDKGKFLPKYLFYYSRFERFREQFRLLSTSLMGGISSKNFAAIEVPLYDLPDQERIVARIEEMFSQLDAGVETLKKTKAQLAVYRQAVLKEAFENCIDSITMASVATMIDPQPSHRTPPEFENGIPYIGIGDIDYTGKTIRFKDARKVNPVVHEEQLQRYTLREGDFVMGKIGTIGKPFRLPLPQNYTLSANVILIQPDAERINPEYLFWQFSSPLITEQLMEGKNETSQPAFGIQKARLLQIKMCSPEDQDRIVYDIREKISVCENIEQTVTLSLQQAEAMRQSILKEAFEGSL